MGLSTSKKNIFLIEDDKDDINFYKNKCIPKELYNVFVFSSITDALSNKKLKPQLILSDLNIVDSKGLSTFEKLYKNFKHVPIIILTGYEDLQDSLSAVSRGAYNYLQKKYIDHLTMTKEIKLAFERASIEKKLIRAKKRAEKQSRNKSIFISNMSHEIRTPLNAVMGISQLLIEEDLTEEQKNLVFKIKNGGESILAIANDLLDLNKIEKGKISIINEDFEIRKVVQECVDLFVLNAHKQNIEVSDYFSSDIPTYVNSDKNRFKQILSNYLSNAIKYAPNSHVLIEVKKQSENILVKVSDQGPGLTEHQIKMLFRPFSQANIKDSLKGSGLGLSICKKLSKLMGGTAGVESTINSGSCFWFSFKPLTSSLRYYARPKLEGTKALIISKNSKLCTILSLQLNSRGILSKFSQEFDQKKSDYEKYDYVFIDRQTVSLNSQQHNFELKNIIWLLKDVMITDKYSYALQSPFYHSKTISLTARVFSGDRKKNTIINHVSPQDINISDKKILIIDDDKLNRLILKKYLDKYTPHVDCEENPFNGVAKIKNKSNYDIVFMDCSMPGLDGYQASKQIKLSLHEIIIVGFTANASEQNQIKCLSCGMDYFLEKPIQKNKLEKILSQIQLSLSKDNQRKSS